MNKVEQKIETLNSSSNKHPLKDARVMRFIEGYSIQTGKPGIVIKKTLAEKLKNSQSLSYERTVEAIELLLNDNGVDIEYKNIVCFGGSPSIITGYLGYIQAMYDAGCKAVRASLVYKDDVDGDRFSYSPADGTVYHQPNPFAKGRSVNDIVGVYAVVILPSGESVCAVCSREELNNLKQRNSTKKGSLWASHFEAMALKTPLRRIVKFIPRNDKLVKISTLDTEGEVK